MQGVRVEIPNEATRAAVPPSRVWWKVCARRIMYALALLIALVVIVVYLSGDPDD